MSGLPRILIADNSRVVRASLAKHLQDRFEIREESDGEAAWQTLVLDSRIVAAIAGASMQKLDGYELVERLRESRLHRLNEMPFLLIVSDTESEENKERARAFGMADTITKMMNKGQILTRLHALTAPPAPPENPAPVAIPVPPVSVPALESVPAVEEGTADFTVSDIVNTSILKQVGRLDEAPAIDSKARLPVVKPHVHMLSAHEIEVRIAEALAESRGSKAPVSVLALGIDNYEALLASLGAGVTKSIGLRFAKLLTGKIGMRDSVGQYRPDCCIVISREANLGRCYTFAGRICRSMATAQIAVRGKPVDLSICAGAASAPEDGALSGSELLALAIKRMDATRCRCNTAAADQEPAAKSGNEPEHKPKHRASGHGRPHDKGRGGEASALRSLATLASDPPEIIESHLGAVGLQLLPLLNMLEHEFHFGLPLSEMEDRFAERARTDEEAA